MANRSMSRWRFSIEKELVDLYLVATIGSSGAVTLKRWNGSAYVTAGSDGWGGIKSITKESTAGQYTVVLQDKYNRLVHFDACFEVPTTGLPAAPVVGEIPGNTDVTAATPQIQVQCTTAGGGSATNPASGEVMHLHFVLQNTSTGGA